MLYNIVKGWNPSHIAYRLFHFGPAYCVQLIKSLRTKYRLTTKKPSGGFIYLKIVIKVLFVACRNIIIYANVSFVVFA